MERVVSVNFRQFLSIDKRQIIDYIRCIEGIKSFSDKLQDEESREIFEARFDDCIHRDLVELERKLICGAVRHGRNGASYVLDRFFQENPDKREVPFVIFGASKAGRENIRCLKFLGIELAGYVDNNFTFLETTEGITVDSPERLLHDWNNCTVLISVMEEKVKNQIYRDRKSVV